MAEPGWCVAARLDELLDDDITEIDVQGRIVAIYHTPTGYYATDGICTHEFAQLAEGLMLGNVIECPKHQGRFDIRSGSAKGAPASEPLRTFPVRVVGQTLEISIPEESR
jgi:3-phenylpropionate/trans-cinnamate dioxygenase ferredoxin subunit